MSKILCVGSINQDYSFFVDHFVAPKETISTNSLQKFAGGKGANQAVALAKNENTVYFIGAVGNDNDGSSLLKLLSSHNIDISNIQVVDDDVTGMAIIQINKEHENCILVHPGANHRLTKQHILNCESLFEEVDAVITQLEVTNEVTEITAELCKKHNKLLVINPAPFRELSKETLESAFVITPNETELGQLTNLPVNNIDEVTIAAKKLSKDCNIKVVVTVGSLGCLYVDNDNCTLVEGYKVNAIDTTAAGDSFNGAFISEYLNTKDIVRSLKYANAFAALSVTKKGAIPSIPSKTETLDFMSN